jgi:hypothetical protein
VKTPRPTDAVPITADDDNYSGDTKVHYLPNEPRPPAGTAPPLDEIAEIDALFTQTGESKAAAPATAPQLLQLPQLPIAEMFQETLWRAFRAGALSADPSYEAFARWYEREVLG